MQFERLGFTPPGPFLYMENTESPLLDSLHILADELETARAQGLDTERIEFRIETIQCMLEQNDPVTNWGVLPS